MVAGPFLVDNDKQQKTSSSSSATPASASGSTTTTSKVTVISSTSFFDSPHFSRREPFKSMPVPVSSDPSPPSDHSDGPPRGYRGHPPPPGYGGHYSPYGYPPGHHYPPPHGYHHPGGPPPGYPHHLPHSHSHPPPPGVYSPGYGGRPIYSSGYPGSYEGGAGSPPVGGHGYPIQHPRDGRSKTPPFQRGVARPTSGSGARPSSAAPPHRASPIGQRESHSNKSSPEESLNSHSQQQQPPSQLLLAGDTPTRGSPTKIADEIETERLRQAALTEISPSQVEPIKTAFHFFVIDMRDSLRPLAEAEVRKSTGDQRALDTYLVNSNLNCRLMKAWEDLSDEERQACMAREEADRRRFMEEEEIACRHCATLTARSKSPKTPERRNSSSINGADHIGGNRRTPNPSPTESLGTHGGADPSPSPISRLTVEPSSSMDHDEKKTDDTVSTVAPNSRDMVTISSARKDGKSIVAKEEPAESQENVIHHTHDKIDGDILDRLHEDGNGANKRPSPTKTDGKGGSPPKRNRLDDAGVPLKEESATENRSAEKK